jgi:hypothetical protein
MTETNDIQKGFGGNLGFDGDFHKCRHQVFFVMKEANKFLEIFY